MNPEIRELKTYPGSRVEVLQQRPSGMFLCQFIHDLAPYRKGDKVCVMPYETTVVRAKAINDGNTYVIYNPVLKKCISGLEYGAYTWTSRPEVAWSFTDKQTAITRAAYASLGDDSGLQVLTRTEALQKLPYGTPKKVS